MASRITDSNPGHAGFEAAGLQRRGVVKDQLGDSAGAEADVRAALALDLAREGRDGEVVRQDLYWSSKRAQGRITEATMIDVAQAGIDTAIAIAQALAAVGRVADAGRTFDGLERMLAGSPLVHELQALRRRLLG